MRVSLRRFGLTSGWLLTAILGGASPLYAAVAPDLHAAFQKAPRQVLIVEVAQVAAAVEHPARALELGRRVPVVAPAWMADKARLLRELARKGTAVKRESFSAFPLFSIEADEAEARRLAADPAVRGVYPNRLHFPSLATSLPFIGQPARAAKGDTGDGTSVAILDTPIHYWNNHFGTCAKAGDAGCSVAVYENFTSDDPETIKDEMHGTNVAGIVLGVAPKTRLLGLNVFKWYASEGQVGSSFEDELKALQWVADNAATYAIVSLNMSLGSTRKDPDPCNDSPLFTAIQSLYHTYGIVSAIASGNESETNSLAEPSCISLAVSVGAEYDTEITFATVTDCRDSSVGAGTIACFSNLNGALDMVAPGVWIDAGGVYDYSGTSMASPHVAGAAAALNSGVAHFDAAATVAHLRLNALPESYGNTAFSRLNIDPAHDIVPAAALAFASYDAESEANAIPASGTLSLPLDTTALAPALTGSERAAYLLVEFAHRTPEAVTLTLHSPSGKSYSFTPPAGMSNFNGFIGRDFAQGEPAAVFKDDDPRGTWTLTFDNTSAQLGHYLNATLFLLPAACTPSCEKAECGDDACGGSCGTCSPWLHCGPMRQCVMDGENCRGDTCIGAIAIPPKTASYTGDTSLCSMNYAGSCSGDFAPEVVYTFTVKTGTSFVARALGFDSVLYLRKDDCEKGTELLCNDTTPKLDNDQAMIKTGHLDPGTYYLFVDGGLASGAYTLEVEMCDPDCTGKTCGEDGCGGTCGACAEGTTCTDGACLAPVDGDADSAEAESAEADSETSHHSGGGCTQTTAPSWLFVALLAAVWRRRARA